MGEKDINDSLAILAGASTDSESEEDNYDLYIGPQVYGPLLQGIDLNAQLLFHYNKNSFSSSNEVFVEGNIGVRAWVTARLELNALMGSNGEHSVFTFGGRFHVSERAAFSLSSKNNGIYGPQIQFGVRYAFLR